LLSSTPGITVVGGFLFTASPESPCASEAPSLVLAGNGRTSTAPSRQERGSLASCQAGILQWPTNQLSLSKPVRWSESLPSSQCDRFMRRPPNVIISHFLKITIRGGRSYHKTTTEELDRCPVTHAKGTAMNPPAGVRVPNAYQRVHSVKSLKLFNSREMVDSLNE